MNEGWLHCRHIRRCAVISGAGRLPAELTGLGHIHKVILLHALSVTLGRRALLLTADEAEATRVCEDLEALGQRPLFLPARDLSLRRVESTSREYEQMRLGTLARMAAGDFDCVVAWRRRRCAVHTAAADFAEPDAAADGGGAAAGKGSGLPP